MKRFFPILIAIIAFTSCEKEADSDKLEDGTLILTEYQKGTDFSSFSTFFIPDSILVIDADKKDTTYVSTDFAVAVNNEFKTELQNRGFIYTPLKERANLGIQVSYIKDSYYLTTAGEPWRFQGYWWPGYWHGYWTGSTWYYPFTLTYTYRVGSLIVDMIDLGNYPISYLTVSTTDKLQKGGPTPVIKPLPIIWNACISGLILPNGGFNTAKATAGIAQAFSQSPYIKTTPRVK